MLRSSGELSVRRLRSSLAGPQTKALPGRRRNIHQSTLPEATFGKNSPFSPGAYYPPVRGCAGKG